MWVAGEARDLVVSGKDFCEGRGDLQNLYSSDWGTCRTLGKVMTESCIIYSYVAIFPEAQKP